jgi:chromosome segregation ATPase
MSKSDPHDPVQKWRDEMERLEAERDRERRREEREERRATMANERAARQQLEARLATLEAQHQELAGQVLETARAATEAIEVLATTRDEIERELKAAIAKMQAAIDELLSRGTREAEKAFEFARERIGAVTDLPNFMPVRRVN